MKRYFLWCCVVLATQGWGLPQPAALAQAVDPIADTQTSEQCSDYRSTRNLYFGDLHVHTTYSFDAFAFGTEYDPADAYANARDRLDFAAVTDHAEFLAETLLCRTPDSAAYNSYACKTLRQGNASPTTMGSLLSRLCSGRRPLVDAATCANANTQIWEQIQAAANQACRPCEFTAFIGYEYTYPTGNRLVVFGGQNVPTEPIDFYDKSPPVELWKTLETVCLAEQGCQLLSIPHNSDLTGGEMFSPTDASGNPMSPQDAQLCADMEKVVEIFQHKGNSECYPGVGNSDPDCDFEQVALSSIIPSGETEVPRLSFVREALKEGLLLQQQIGVNPFRFGFIGCTDTHNATAGAVAEANFAGHTGKDDDEATERLGSELRISFNPGGLTAVWATENTREAIFAALQNRESYATSGTKIAVRFFGGWNLPTDICSQTDLAALGYEHGVPMGGILSASPGSPPRFVVQAQQDPAGASLQKIQIIKGWTTAGEVHESVQTVLEVPTGTAELCVVWTDEGFNTLDPSFYYARILETETERWSWFDCQNNNIDCSNPRTVPWALRACCRDSHVTEPIQERAWTSPIWYNP